MNIRNYKPGDEAVQVAIHNAAAADFPKFKAATVEEVRRRTQAADFDPATRFYAEEGGKVVGYATFADTGRVSFPWVAKGAEAAQEPLFQKVIDAMKQRGIASAFAAYRGDWPVVKDFFQTHGFRLVREMVNFIIDIVEMPTPAARPSLPFSPLKREDVPAIFELAPEALRARTAAELEKHLFDNPAFAPESLFVLRGRTGGTPAAIGILLDAPDYADPRQIDPNNPCFRLGAFGSEGMTAKKVQGLFSFLCRPGRDVSSLALDLMGHAAFRLEESATASLAAQVPSDVPHLLRFYQQHFRRQGSFPIYERDL